VLTPPSALLGAAEIARRLAAVMDASSAAAGGDRARLIVIRQGKVAAIERFRAGQHYFVLPGGGVEEGETIPEAARREAAEELGVAVVLGKLRAVIHAVSGDGSALRHWCFDASTDSADIAIAGGPESDPKPEDGTYAAVWIDLATLDPERVWPFALARLIVAHQGNWPAEVLELIDQ
jgi:8-oxo-dGTP diphosphatase